MPSRVSPRYVPASPEDMGGPRAAAIDTIVIHTTEGGRVAGDIAAWFARDDRVASAHYIIDGVLVVQQVAEELVAYHCGNRAVHQRSIGIEVVGHAGDPATWSAAKLRQLVELCADIIDRHPGIAVDHVLPGIIGHADVPDPKNPALKGGASHHWDPGPHFPWAAFLVSLQEEFAAECKEQRFPPGPPPEKE